MTKRKVKRSSSVSFQGCSLLPSILSLKQIKLAYDLGINAFDTANTYSNGLSEALLGKAIKQYNLPRDKIVVMTKVFFPMNRDASGPSLASMQPGNAKLYKD